VSEQTFEVNFDGIVGPTHNYSGLSYGNIASQANQKSESNPKLAALQGLEKMKFLASLGIRQAVLPPHERPHLPTFKNLGFHGSDKEILSQVFHHSPDLLLECSSAANMWAANSATVSPSIDSADEHVHFTPANLSSKFHRSIEPETTSHILKIIFKDPMYFVHHPILPADAHFADEGAANHTRFCKRFGDPGIQLFVFGRYAFKESPLKPRVFPARQTYESSQALARRHQLYPAQTIFAQQSPRAIDAGVFHNDVISVGTLNVFFYHEAAFVAKEVLIDEIRQKVQATCDTEMIFIEVEEKLVSIKDAVSSYLFNSQLIALEDGSLTLIAPTECEQTPSVKSFLDQLISNPQNPIRSIHYLNLRESMRNGGGPACLRLRVVLSQQELDAAYPGVFLTERLYERLKTWITKHYRDKLVLQDLADPKLLEESQHALDELTRILGIGSLYSFQK
jgi:succinylarginine dihydrolase